MVCIYCGSDTGVINSRPQKRSNKIWRRRECQNCHIVFTTIESIDYGGTWRVAQYDNSLSVFSRDTLLTSIYESCKHRPAAAVDAAALTDTVISKLAKGLNDSLLTRTQIISTVYQTLTNFDKVAAIHYQAFHKI